MRILAPLRELRERAAFLREITPNAAAILTRIGAGTERRARLIAELEHEGNATLENMAYTALTTDDKILASAVASVIGRRKREDRPFSTHEIADAAVGDLYAQLSAKLLEVENAAAEVEGRHREFITSEQMISMLARVFGIRARFGETVLGLRVETRAGCETESYWCDSRPTTLLSNRAPRLRPLVAADRSVLRREVA